MLVSERQDLVVEAIYLAKKPAESIDFELARQARGWWKPRVIERRKLEPEWQGDKMRLTLPLEKNGIYRSEWWVRGEEYDRRPLQVGR